METVFNHEQSLALINEWYLLAVFSWSGAIVCAFVSLDIQFIVLAITMILGFVIPGHIFNYQAKKSHV